MRSIIYPSNSYRKSVSAWLNYGQLTTELDKLAIWKCSDGNSDIISNHYHAQAAIDPVVQEGIYWLPSSGHIIQDS